MSTKAPNTRRVKRCAAPTVEDALSPTAATSHTTLDYVSPPMATKMAARLNMPIRQIPVVHHTPSGLRVTAPPVPLDEVEALFGPDSPLAPTASSSSSPASTPRFEPPSPSHSSSSEDSGSAQLSRRLREAEHQNQALRDEVRRLTNAFATTHIEIRICGSPTKRGLPCKNRKGTCPYHSSQSPPNVSVRFAPGPPAQSYPSPSVDEMWQI
jgi:hypothetical protein